MSKIVKYSFDNDGREFLIEKEGMGQ